MGLLLRLTMQTKRAGATQKKVQNASCLAQILRTTQGSVTRPWTKHTATDPAGYSLPVLIPPHLVLGALVNLPVWGSISWR